MERWGVKRGGGAGCCGLGIGGVMREGWELCVLVQRVELELVPGLAE